MKIPTLIMIMVLLCSGCSLLSSDDVDFGVCDAGLFEKLEERSKLSLRILYDMPWTREDELEEEEVEAQRKAIADMHEEMLTALDEREFWYGVRHKSNSSPTLYLGINENAALEFLCTHEKVEHVREKLVGTIN